MIITMAMTGSAILEVPKGVETPDRWECWPELVRLEPSPDRRSCSASPIPGARLGIGRCAVTAYGPGRLRLGDFYLKILADEPAEVAQESAP